MVTVLITSFLLFAAISYAIYWWQRSSSPAEAEPRMLQPPVGAGGLFAEVGRAEMAALAAAEREAKADERRTALLERARAGDKESLNEASATGDARLYGEVLDTLVDGANSDERLLSLVSYIARNRPLRVNQKLAARFIESWKNSPETSSTAKMLHVAALSGDAGVYRQAIEIIAQFWRERRLTALSADELRQLVESEYWTLPSASRNSGAGFVLKRALAHLRRELMSSTNGP